MTARVRYVTRFLVGKHAKLSAVILLNSESVICDRHLNDLWRAAAFRACTDGAGNSLYELCKSHSDFPPPHLLSGDFDSISPQSLNYFRAIVDQIVVVGGLSGRFDHVMGAVNTLSLLSTETDLPVYLLENNSLVTLLPAGVNDLALELSLLTGKCGLIPIGQSVSNVCTRGLQWNLAGDKLAFGALVSTSNVILTSPVHVEADGALLWTMELRHETDDKANGV